MLRLLETGLWNPTFWAAVWVFVAVARTGAVARPRGWAEVLAWALAVGAIGSFAIGLLRAYVAPRDVMQDIVSAREFLAGRSMYPAHMNDLMRAAIDEEGGRPLGLGADYEAKAVQIREASLGEHWVQAHPPSATLLIAPAEAAFGVLGGQIAAGAMSFFAVLLALGMLVRELRPGWRPREYFLVGALLFGWGSMTTVFRNGQWDAILLVLLTASWKFLRTGRAGWAGIFAGLAIGIKLFPTVLLLVFLTRNRKAFVTATGTIAGVVAVCLTLCHPGDLADARATMALSVDEYKNYPTNLSAYGFLARVGDWLSWSSAVTAAEWWAVAGFVGAGFGWLLWRARKQPDPAGTDWAFATAVAIMPLASPVAWDHYLALMVLPVAVLTTRVESYRGRLLLAVGCTLLAVPDATVLWINSWTRTQGLEGAAVWIVEPLRTYALVAIALMAAAHGIERKRSEHDSTP